MKHFWSYILVSIGDGYLKEGYMFDFTENSLWVKKEQNSLRRTLDDSAIAWVVMSKLYSIE